MIDNVLAVARITAGGSWAAPSLPQLTLGRVLLITVALLAFAAIVRLRSAAAVQPAETPDARQRMAHASAASNHVHQTTRPAHGVGAVGGAD